MTRMTEVSQGLLGWYRAHRRTLPWREEPTAYRVWVSEIMLQQTQVVTVIPYFERWMAAFPDVQTLADAPIDDVLALWSGLGYYRRAHMLHRAARVVVDHHDGALPDTLDGLLSLPGVGRYTAGAIASIAFNLPAPIVDGNVIRVLCRLEGIETDPREGATNKRLWSLAEALIPEGQARDFNQSMMELGALVCSPRNPDCQGCPVSKWCQALATDQVAKLPLKVKRKAKRPMALACAMVQQADTGRFLLVQRPDKGLFAGLWEFPSVEVERLPSVTQGDRQVRGALAEHLTSMGLEVSLGASVSRLQHILTHIRLTVQPFEATCTKAPAQMGPTVRWVERDELDGQPLSAATRKLVQRHILNPEPNLRLL